MSLSLGIKKWVSFNGFFIIFFSNLIVEFVFLVFLLIRGFGLYGRIFLLGNIIGVIEIEVMMIV